MKLIQIVLLMLAAFSIDHVNGALEYRLDKNVVPLSYSIDLELPQSFEQKKSFSGSTMINIKVVNKTQSFKIHKAEELTIYEVLVNNVDAPYTYDKKTETLIITADLNAGNHTLEFPKFYGKLYEDMYGFYISYYENDQKQTEAIATTQFESTYARRAFPCFDEPSFKATFKISLKYPDGYTVKSNQPSTVSPRGPTTKFETTPVMSTYQLAFIVSKFGNMPAESNPNMEILARKQVLNSTKYAASFSPKVIAKLSTYMDIEYFSMGITQLNQIAIPDFAAGAMENWGAVTYRETSLLWDEKESTVKNKQRVATVIAHEFTHMWFGNLVTMAWWEDTWLNEGFARYFEYHITLTVEDQWELEKQFVIEQQQVIFESDSVNTSMPLSSEANSPSEVSAKFGSITYNKGGSVIRMMKNFLGETAFKAGLQTYLKANNYGNTKPDNLFSSFTPFTAVGGANLSTVMRNWIYEGGFPVVHVNIVNDTSVILTQERFLFSGSNDTKWYIPITFTTKATPNFKDTAIKWMEPTKNLTINANKTDGWIIVNLQETGYYRVNYDSKLWNYIKEEFLNSTKMIQIHELNRAGIIDDAMNLARAGIIQYNTALDLTNYMENETSYYPWYPTFNNFAYLRKRIGEGDLKTSINKHLTTIMKGLKEGATFDTTKVKTHVGMLNNVQALKWLCELNDVNCTSQVKTLFKDYKETSKRIDPNLRSVVYCYGLMSSDNQTADWNFLWDKFTTGTVATESTTLLDSLGCTTNTTLLQDLLDKSVTPGSGIRQQDAYSAFSTVITHTSEGIDVGFNFLMNNYTEIRENYGSMNALTKVINLVADYLTTEEQLNQFEMFVTQNKNNLDEAASVADSAVQTAHANFDWVDEYSPQLMTYFGLKSPDNTGGASVTAVNTLLLASLLCAIFKLRN